VSRKPNRTPRERQHRVPFNPRPFAGAAYEADLVALREVVPSATAPVTLKDGRTITVATVLPLAWSWMVRRDGSIILALQTAPRSGDLGIDLGHSLAQALKAGPGNGDIETGLPDADAVPLSELIGPDAWDVTVHPGFDWWITDEDRSDVESDVEASLQRANAQVVPTERLDAVDAAYWCQIGERSHLRWVFTGDEERLLDGLARLHTAGTLALGEGTRFIGTFRALGSIVPVWDLPGDSTAEGTEASATAFRTRLDQALDGGPLTPEERRSRAGVVSRQLTLH
jgi:hypothetical protein